MRFLVKYGLKKDIGMGAMQESYLDLPTLSLIHFGQVLSIASNGEEIHIKDLRVQAINVPFL